MFVLFLPFLSFFLENLTGLCGTKQEPALAGVNVPLANYILVIYMFGNTFEMLSHFTYDLFGLP